MRLCVCCWWCCRSRYSTL